MHRVVIAGKSLFATALAQMLTNYADAEAIEIIRVAPSLEIAQPLIEADDPDAIIVVGADETNTAIFGTILSSHADLPIICTDPDTDKIQIITSQHVGARSSDLLAVIAALPERR